MKTILIVDDESGIIDVLTDLLVDEGYHVISANNGRQGLDQLKNGTPDLVLLDIMMPVQSGRGMLEAMRADPKYAAIPVVILSAVPRLVAFPEGAQNPAFGAYLRKPFSLVTLFDAIEAALNGAAV